MIFTKTRVIIVLKMKDIYVFLIVNSAQFWAKSILSLTHVSCRLEQICIKPKDMTTLFSISPLQLHSQLGKMCY